MLTEVLETFLFLAKSKRGMLVLICMYYEKTQPVVECGRIFATNDRFPYVANLDILHLAREGEGIL